MVISGPVKLLISISGIIFISVLFIKPDYIFYLLLATRSLFELYFFVEVLPGIRLTHIIGVFIPAIFLLFFLPHIPKIFSLNINRIYLIFLILTIPSIFFTKSYIVGLGDWLRFVQIFIFLNMALILLTPGNKLDIKKINIICWCAFITYLIPALGFYKNYITGAGTVAGGAKFTYTYGIGHLASFSFIGYAVFPFIVLKYAIEEKTSKKIFWFIIILLTLFSLHKAWVRSPALGGAIILFTFGIINKKKNVRSLTFLSAFILMSLIILFRKETLMYYINDVIAFIKSRGDIYSLDPRLFTYRMGTWQGYFRHYEGLSILNKFFGIGHDAYHEVKLISTLGIQYKSMEHNNYLYLLIRTGIIGLSLYITFFIFLFKESLKLLKNARDTYTENISRIFLGVLIGYLLTSMVEHWLYSVTYHYFFSVFAGFVIGANISEKSETETT